MEESGAPDRPRPARSPAFPRSAPVRVPAGGSRPGAPGPTARPDRSPEGLPAEALRRPGAPAAPALPARSAPGSAPTAGPPPRPSAGPPPGGAAGARCPGRARRPAPAAASSALPQPGHQLLGLQGLPAVQLAEPGAEALVVLGGIPGDPGFRQVPLRRTGRLPHPEALGVAVQVRGHVLALMRVARLLS